MLALLPGETVYSWAVANHDARHAGRIRDTALEFLGARHAVRQHDVPRGLAGIPLAQPQAFSAEELLRSHTVGGYYWPFLEVSAKIKVLSAAAAGVDPHWRRLLLGASRSRPVGHPLRACPLCIDVDRREWGRAYWHVSHQLPTSLVCTVHGTVLRFVPGPYRTWYRPEQACSPTLADEPEGIDARVAAAVGECFTSCDFIEAEQLRHAIKRRMIDLGAIRSAAGATGERLRQWFGRSGVSRWCAQIDGLASFADGEWISGLLWRRRRSRAIEWALLWAALEWSSTHAAQSALDDAIAGRAITRDGQLLLFQDECSQAPNALWQVIDQGDSYEDLQRRTGLSRGDVVHWLEIDHALRMAWQRQLARVNLHVLQSALAEGYSTKVVLRKHLAAVSWLRKHRPDLLAEVFGAGQRRGDDAGTQATFA